MNTPLTAAHAAARRRHRRHLRPRPGAGRGRSPRAATPSPSSPATPTRSRRVARRIAGSHGIVGDVARKDDAHAIALQVGAALGGLDVLVNNASSLGPVPLAPARRHRVRGLRGGARHQPGRPVPSHQGAARRCSPPRRAKAPPRDALGRAQRLERRRGHALRRLGRVRREQGGAGAPEPDLGRGARGRTASPSSPSIRATWTRRCTRSPCPMPIRRRSSGRATRRARSWRGSTASAPRPRRERARRMKAATLPVQRPRDARLLVVDADGRARRRMRAPICPTCSRPATWWSPTTPPPCRRASPAAPARAARRSSCAWPGARSLARRTSAQRFSAVVFGEGDFRIAHRGPARCRRRSRPAIGSPSDRSTPRCCAPSAIRAWSRSASPATPTR